MKRIIWIIQGATFQITGTVAVFFGTETVTQVGGVITHALGLVLVISEIHRAGKEERKSHVRR